jgi:MoxR-like ATPase
MRIRIGYTDQTAEREILRHSAEPGLEKIRPVISSEDLRHLQETVGHVMVDDALVDYMLTIVKHTREHEALAMGVSPRGAQALFRASRAGRSRRADYVTPGRRKRMWFRVSHRVPWQPAPPLDSAGWRRRESPEEIDAMDVPL